MTDTKRRGEMKKIHRMFAATCTVSMLMLGLNASSKAAEVKLKGGLHVFDNTGKFKFSVGGRIQNDWAYLRPDNLMKASTNVESGTEFRRIRIYLKGLLYGFAGFKAQYDFAGSKVHVKDMYVTFKHTPLLGTLTIGHQKEPFSLEELTSSKYITFVERALTSKFSPSRNTGLTVKRAFLHRRLLVTGGAYLDADSTGNATTQGYSFTARIAGVPLKVSQRNFLLHLGAAYSYRKPAEEKYSITVRPEIHMAPKFDLDYAGMLTSGVTNVHLSNTELALLWGPVSLQAEGVVVFAEAGGEFYKIYGFYSYATWMITGEMRNYKEGAGKLKGFKPVNPAGNGGCGAWELGVRFAYLDAGDINGGEARSMTLGLNWYMNEYLRVSINYVYADMDNYGSINAVVGRLQAAF